MNKLVLLCGILLAGALVSCGTHPDYVSLATMETPTHFEAAKDPGYAKMEVTSRLLDVFDDSELRRLVALTETQNPDLLQSQARLEEVGLNFKQTRGRLFPTIDGTFSNLRQETPPLGGAGQIGFIQGEFEQYTLGLTTSWEVDLWGKLRAGTNAAAADRRSAAADTEALRQSLAAQTMQAYFSLIGATQLVELDRRRVASFASTVDQVERRFELGSASLADQSLAEADWESARADLEGSIDSRNQTARQLRVLVGKYPTEKVSAQSWPSLRKSIPASIPSEVLLSRPDLIAAYESLVAADARVTVAHREMFPSFILTAEGGRQGSVLSDLADSGFNYWSTLASLSAPVFRAGQLRNEYRAADKRAEQAYRAWQSRVLAALREVEDALGSEQYLAREENRRVAALEAGKQALTRTRRDFEAGVTDLINLLETQRRVFQTEGQTIQVRQARLNNRVALGLALGRGF